MMGLKELHYNFRILHRILRSAPSLFIGAIHQTRRSFADGLWELDIRSEPAQAIDKRGCIIGGTGTDADRRLHRHAGSATSTGARATDIAGGLDLASFGDFLLQGARHDIKIQKVRGIYKSLVGGKSRKFRLKKAGFFEIYDLKLDASGGTFYEVDYEVNAPEKKGLSSLLASLNPFSKSRGSISVTAARRGKASTEPTYLQLDSSQLRGGNYDLVVRVTDKVANITKESPDLSFKI